jgi:peptide/nickel transport system substrate-binding protein
MLRVSPLAVPPIKILQDTYHIPMSDWLEEFTLPDGYQPFDSNYALKVAEELNQNGVEGIPEDEDGLRELFGVGWWKYDVEEASKLLESVGFTKNDDGKWLLPDGTIWTINILSPVNYEAESERLSFAVAESWNQFGIDTVVNGVDAGTWNTSIVTGNFDVANHWGGACAVTPDIYTNMSYWHTQFVVPVGETANRNVNRVDSEAISAILDQYARATNPEQGSALAQEFLKQMVVEMTWIPMVGTSKFVPVTTHWWDGFPNAENQYNGPWWWWSCFKYILPHLEESGNL